MKTVTKLPSIRISRNELRDRQERIQEGNSLEELIHILGGIGYKTECHGKRKAIFWRFRILDATNLREQYEIYMGEFEEDKFVFGAFIPQA